MAAAVGTLADRRRRPSANDAEEPGAPDGPGSGMRP